MAAMAHPIRVYCQGPTPPTPAALRAFAAARGIALAPYEDYAEDDPATPDWDSVGFTTRPGRPPLFVELEWLDAPDARLVHADLAAARRALAARPAGPDLEEARRRILATRFVAGIAVSGANLDEHDWRAAEVIAACFEAEARGVTWVVGRGFFLGGREV